MKEKLRKLIASCREQAKGIIAKAETEDRGITSAEAEQIEALTAQCADAEKSIAVLDGFQEREESLERILPARSLRLDPNPHAALNVQVGEDHSYKDPKAGTNFVKAVYKAALNPGRLDRKALQLDRMQNIESATYMEEGGTIEGYLVPPETRTEILRTVFEQDALLSLFTIIPTQSNQVNWLEDETTPWGTTGVTADWVGQGKTIAKSKPTLKPRSIMLHKVAARVDATDEMLEDAPMLQNMLQEQAPEAIAYLIAEAFMTGDGVAKPLGFFGHSSEVVVTKAECGTSTQTADTIVAANLTTMQARLKTGRGTPVWLIANDAWPQIPLLTIGQAPVYTAPVGGMRNAITGGILGWNAVMTPHATTIGDKGDIQLINPAGYLALGKSGGTKFDMSIHLLFDLDQTCFRWTLRIGGAPYNSSALTLPKSSKKLSAFVQLEARS